MNNRVDLNAEVNFAKEIIKQSHLSNIQHLFLSTFGTYDKDKAFVWMLEELGELAQAVRKGHTKDQIFGEYSDFIAWVLSMANILDIKLNESLCYAVEK